MRTALLLGAGMLVWACPSPCPAPDPAPASDGGTVAVLRCTTMGVDRRTFPAGAAADVNLVLRCEGGETPIPATVAVRARLASALSLEVSRAVELRAGEVTVPLRLPEGAIAAGAGTVRLEVSARAAEGSAVELRTGDVELRLSGHLPASAVASQWEAVAAFEPAPPAPGARRVEVLVRDVTGDDVLDAVVVWRDGGTLTVETYAGPMWSRLSARSSTDARLDVGTAGESVRFVRRKGASSDRQGVVVWSAVDATTREARVALIDVSDAAPGPARVFDSMGLPPVERVLGLDAVFESEAMDGDAPEVLLFWLSQEGGRRSFVTTLTQAASGKQRLLGTQSSLDGVSGDVVADGMARAGLVRSWKVSTSPSTAVDVSNVLAWVHVTGAPQRNNTLRRVALSGPAAGTVLGGLVSYAPGPQEALLAVDSTDADGDAVADVVLVTRDGAGLTAVRSFLHDVSGAVTGQWRTAMPGLTLQPPTVRVWNSAQASHLSGACQVQQRPAFWCGTAGHFVVVGGGAVAGLPVLAAVSRVAAGFLPLSVPTRSQLGPASASGAVRVAELPSGGRPAPRLAFGRVLPDDEVLLAAHPNGVAVKLGGGRGGLFLQRPGVIETAPGLLAQPLTGAPWLLEDESSPGDTFLVFPSEAPGGDATWTVWLWTVRGLEGPSTWTLPAALGRFRPVALSAPSLDFARQDGSRLEEVSIPMATARQLVRGQMARTFTEADVRALPGVDRPAFPRTGQRVLRARPRQEVLLKAQLADGRFKAVGVGREPTFGGSETVAVVAVDEADPCPWRTVLYPGDPATTPPVTLSESFAEGCGDLDVPVLAADVCGVGGQQVLTSQRMPRDGGVTWSFHVWMRGGAGIVRALVGSIDTAADTEPLVTAGDVNGDGSADVVVSFEDRPSVVFFSDGLGQAFGGASVGGFSDAVRGLPGAGPALGAGQTACGAGLQCQYGSGTRTSSAQASSKAELL